MLLPRTDPRLASKASRGEKEGLLRPLFPLQKDGSKRDPRKSLLFSASHAMLKVLQPEWLAKPVRV